MLAVINRMLRRKTDFIRQNRNKRMTETKTAVIATRADKIRLEPISFRVPELNIFGRFRSEAAWIKNLHNNAA